MREAIRFILGDDPVEIRACDPTTTLLDWLRLERGLTGTKEGCAEGDCGACTVAVGRVRDGALTYEPVNSCIRFLPTLDGCHVRTVEHLAEGGELHAVQRALVEHHGSQCGFCTPGIVMSLACLLEAEPSPDPARIDDALAGNLCRCTGYRPIVAAALAAAGDARPSDPDGRAALRHALEALADAEPIEIAGPNGRCLAPASLADLREMLRRHPDAILLSGGTDVGLWVTKGLRRLDPVLWLGRIAALRGIAEAGGEIRIGAGTSHAELIGPFRDIDPQLGELMRRFGGEQIRAAGTIGGNLANGSPIGDLAPALIALDATLVLDGPEGERRLPLEAFFLAYGRQDRRPGEFVSAVLVRRPGSDDLLHVSKIAKRFDEDISSVCGAFRLTRDAEGRVAEARLAFGGMAGIPTRARRAEDALLGRPFTPEAAEAAARALVHDLSPLDDWRASAAYRMLVAQNLLRRFALEATAPGIATRVAGGLAAHGRDA